MSSEDITPRRRSRRLNHDTQALEPHRLDLDVVVGGRITNADQQSHPSSASTLTTTPSIQMTPRHRRVQERSELTLFQLSNVASSLKDVDATEEEALYDLHCRENGGASDSEDKPDVVGAVDDEDPALPTLEDKNMSDERKEAAELNGFISVTVKEEPGGGDPWCWGAPVGWKPPEAPSKWKLPKLKAGVPKFNKVDNPGNWSKYSFQPHCKKKQCNKYVHYWLPTGVVPVPINEDGKRIVNGWEFFYNGWTKDSNDGPGFREHCSKENMFPHHRRGSLDHNKLRRLRLTKERMSDVNGNPDSLFFLAFAPRPQH
mgnify:CR=1 FL=1